MYMFDIHSRLGTKYCESTTIPYLRKNFLVWYYDANYKQGEYIYVSKYHPFEFLLEDWWKFLSTINTDNINIINLIVHIINSHIGKNPFDNGNPFFIKASK